MKKFWCESDEIYYSDSINFDLVIIINTKLNSESFLRNKKIHASVVSLQPCILALRYTYLKGVIVSGNDNMILFTLLE